MGVAAETGKTLGKDYTIASLLDQEFESVFLATGGWDSRLARSGKAGTERPVPGVYLLVDLMKAESDIPVGADVVIAGGGKLALDAAKICKERGAANITILYRESWEQSPVTDADARDIGDENITVRFNTAIGRMIGQADQLTEIEYVALDTSERETIPAATLIIPAGRFPELIFKKVKPEADEASENAEPENPSRWEGVEPYKQPAYHHDVGLLAEGDALSDFSAAIRAIGAGRRAAASIHQIMYDIDPVLPEAVIVPSSELQNVDHVEAVDAGIRQIMPLCSPKEMDDRHELEKGFTTEMAKEEAERCLQCGLICYERNGDESSDQQEIQKIA